MLFTKTNYWFLFSSFLIISTGEDKKSLAPVLRAAAVPLLDQSICRSSEVNGGKNQQILDSMLCAGMLLLLYFIWSCKSNKIFVFLGFLQGGIGLFCVNVQIKTKNIY